jgi:crotonobetainyl-CoA:carnitine CoA-transferase CaiB-like acyl-CoA transferase
VIAAIEHPDLGTLRYPVPFQRSGGTPPALRRPSARLGEHTAEVLAEWLTGPT